MFRKILCASLGFLFFLSPSIALSEELNPLANVKEFKEKAVETIETIKEKAKDIIVKSGEKLLKNQTVQDLYLLATSRDVRVVQVGGRNLVLPFALTEEGLEIQKRFIIKAIEVAIEVYCDGCFSLDPSLRDASQLSLRTIQNTAPPTLVTFTETFAGFNSATPDFPDSRGSALSFSSLSGNRTGVLPTPLTQNMSGRFEASNGSANTLVNVPISGNITGSGIFINGQPLKTQSTLSMQGIIDFKSAQTKEFTINPNGTSSGTFSGNTFDTSNPNELTGTVILDYSAKPK